MTKLRDNDCKNHVINIQQIKIECATAQGVKKVARSCDCHAISCEIKVQIYLRIRAKLHDNQVISYHRMGLKVK